MKTVLYSTLFPVAEPYFAPFLQSIEAQIDSDFDICFALDNISPDSVKEKMQRSDVQFIMANNDTPASIRERSLLELCKHYDAIVLVDSDDILYPTRVRAAKQGLEKADAYACALDLIDNDGKSLGKTFTSPEVQNWEVFLSSVNSFGFSNTMYRTELLKQLFPIPKETVMVDWLIATKALALNAQLHFDPTPHMLYRQYENNTARVLSPYKAQQITKSSALVLHHYEYVLEDPIIQSKASLLKQLQEQQEKTQRFVKSMQDPTKLELYTSALNDLKDVFLWWDCVAHPDLEILWT